METKATNALLFVRRQFITINLWIVSNRYCAIDFLVNDYRYYRYNHFEIVVSQFPGLVFIAEVEA
ncbi:hypothetical protein BLOT_001900 [Blomia tropicalis]|nr:hypothetical protein BLOT_001900 [Blomia tropicalis]